MSTYGQIIVTTNDGQWWRMMSYDEERYLMMMKFVSEGKWCVVMENNVQPVGTLKNNHACQWMMSSKGEWCFMTVNSV